MPPRKVKPDPEVKSQDSPDLSTIQPVTGDTTSTGTNTVPGKSSATNPYRDNPIFWPVGVFTTYDLPEDFPLPIVIILIIPLFSPLSTLAASKLLTLTFVPGLRLPNLSPTHPLPVIHETGESFFSSQFPTQGITQGHIQDPFLYPNISGIGNIPDASQDLFAFNPTGDYNMNMNMNNMSRTILPSSGNARNQVLGNPGTGAGITKRPSRQPNQAGSVTNQAATRAALDMGANPGQSSNQNQGFDIDLTGMDYPIGSPTAMGLYSSPLNSGMDPNAFASMNQDYRNVSPAPKFDPDFPATPDFITPTRYESFGEEDEYETKPDPRRIRTQGTPTPASRNRRTSLAAAEMSPATANTSSPANSSFATPEQGIGGGSGGSSRAAPNPPPYQAHVPPNRIAEAGPVTHPDPEWRPYGVNHWHVFLREPSTLKYLSSTEIKDIREHCYELAARGAGDEDDGNENDEPRLIAEGSPYTTADAQAVWKHCDAYVRRRGQVRNNQAARRSRQRKDAETRYWKAKAIEYGAPDVEFDWSMVEESPPAPARGGSSSSSRPAAAESGGGGGAAVQTRARARAQTGQGRAQQQQGGGRQGQAAAQRASAPSAAPPEFDFNQPLKYDEDDETFGSGFDAFTGEF